MAAEVRPAALAAVLDVAERTRASDLIELVRRIDSALRPHAKLLEREGPALWDAVAGAGGTPAGVDDERLVPLLGALVELDRIGDELSAWAVDAAPAERPDEAVDAAVADVTARLEALGVAREERPRPPGARSRG